MYKTVVYAVKTWNFTKRDSQKILFLQQPFTVFKKFTEFTKKHQYLEPLRNKLTEPLLQSLLKKDPAQMFFKWNFFKAPFLHNPSEWLPPFWFVKSLPENDIKMTTIEAIIMTLMLALNVFLSFAITFEAAIQNNLTKSWRFSREMSLVEFCYSIKLLYSSMVIVKPMSLGFTVILPVTEAVVRRCFSK